MATSTSPQVHPSWKRSGSRYEQPYGFQEQLYAKIMVPPGERGLFLVSSSVGFRHTGSGPQKKSADELAAVFRRAWIQMRHRFPALAVLGRPEGKVYEPPRGEADVEAWARETFLVLRGQRRADLFRDLAKTAYATLHYLPEARELFLLTEHSNLDGRGVMHFWDQFFRAVAEPAGAIVWDGSEVARLPPRSDDLLDLGEEAPGRGRQLALEMLGALATDEPICLPVDVAAGAPARNGSVETRLSARATDAVVRACKARGTTVTAAWHAAVVLATRDAQRRATGAAGQKFVGFSNFDLRAYFPKQAGGGGGPGAHAVSNHHSVLPIAVEPEGKSFDEIVRQLTAFYRRGISEPAGVWSALRPMIEAITPAFAGGQVADTTPAISSLGNVDAFIGRQYGADWEVEDVWFGDTVTGPWLEGFMWAWRGRIVLCSCYNTGYYAERDVAAFHERVSQIMMEGLGLCGDDAPLLSLI